MTAALAAAARLDWGAAALQQRLQAVLPGLAVEVLASATSTNTVLLDRARGGDAAPRLLVAEHQTAGRGRLGRGWVSSPGASLTFSLALPMSPPDFSGLSLAVGLALADALDPAADPVLWLKWPNDLWLRDGDGSGRKLGGILIETLPIAGGQRQVVVGVGLNVRPQPAWADAPSVRADEARGPEGRTYGLACLHEIDAAASAPAALARLAAPLLQALLAFESRGFAPLASAYARRDLLRGQAVTTTLAGAAEGIADGVDEGGALRVRAAGRVHRVASGEVSVRLQPPRSA